MVRHGQERAVTQEHREQGARAQRRGAPPSAPRRGQGRDDGVVGWSPISRGAAFGARGAGQAPGASSMAVAPHCTSATSRQPAGERRRGPGQQAQGGGHPHDIAGERQGKHCEVTQDLACA